MSPAERERIEKEAHCITNKTSEQFVIERCRLIMNLDGTDIVLDSIPSVARMAEAYAAQEFADYKSKLKKRTDTDKARIEKEAWQKWEEDQKTNPQPVNPNTYVYGYIAGATSEHDKARNQAIQDCQNIFDELCGLVTYKIMIEKFESLKTKLTTGE